MSQIAPCKMNSLNSNQKTGSRREFLGHSLRALATVGAYSLLPSLPSLAAAASRPRLRFGLCTYLWGKDWDVPTLIANCQKAGLGGVEPRTSMKFAHGIELTLTKEQRADIKKRFADSPVQIVSLACGERMDWPNPDKLKTAVEAAKAYLQLSRDIGCEVLRVFPNQFNPGVTHEKTIEQIARALNELGAVAADLGQEVSLEAHGPAGELPTMCAIMDQVTRRNVRVRLNCDARDTKDPGFAANFDLVKNHLSRIIHLHDLKDPKYPYQLMVDLLVKAKWEGWALAELEDAPTTDRVAGLIEQRQLWEGLVEKAVARGA